MTLARHPLRWTALALAAALTACGGGGGDDTVTIDTSNDRGSIQRNPPTQLAALSNLQFSASLAATANGQSLLRLTTGSPTGTVQCGIDLRYLQYGTVGGAGERTNATGALMIPTGGAGCSGPRPIVLYAHGTNTSQNYNLALLGSSNAAASEAGVIAATYAAKGYIVVAPNYAGYDASTLGYHPYLNAEQQSKDMLDALTAARKALTRISGGTSDSGRLFVSGYSQGGHVAMATARALQNGGTPATAFAGGSGPYALSAFADDIFNGQPIVGGTLFAPLLTTSWKRSFGNQAGLNIYGASTEFYTAAYAPGIDTLMPSTLSLTAPNTDMNVELITRGKVPQAAMFGNDLAGFNVASPFAPLFGAPASALIRTDYATAVQGDKVTNPCPRAVAPTGPLDCTPAHPLRAVAKLNDLRNWTPAANLPVLMCGGAGDPTVFFTNTARTTQYFADQGRTATVLSVDLAASAAGPFTNAMAGFQATINGVGVAAAAAASAAGGDLVAQGRASATAIAQNYHSTVAPFCAAVAEGFFQPLR